MMKIEVYVYTVVHNGNRFWQGVFDCEISSQQIAEAFHSENPNQNDIVSISVEKRTHFRSQRNTLAVIPEVQAGIMCALSENMNDVDWFKDKLLQLSLDQPIIHEYLLTVKQQHGELPALVGAIVYGTIESQIEADQL